jgi:hypothetical protein
MTVPPTLPSKPSGSVLTESMLLAGRMIKRWRLEPLLPLQSLLFPTLLLIVYFLLAPGWCRCARWPVGCLVRWARVSGFPPNAGRVC